MDDDQVLHYPWYDGPLSPLLTIFLVSPKDDHSKKEESNQESQPTPSGNEQGSSSGFDVTYHSPQGSSGAVTLDMTTKVENASLQGETFSIGSLEEIASDIHQGPESSNTDKNETLGKLLDGDHQAPVTIQPEIDHCAASSETCNKEPEVSML